MLLLSSPAYAVDLMATGDDYILMSDNQKTELVTALYKIFREENKAPEDGVVSLNYMYSVYQKDPLASDSQVILKAPVMDMLANIMTYNPEKDFKRELQDLSKHKK